MNGVVLSALLCLAGADTPLSIPEQLESESVTIVAGLHQGSGTVHVTTDKRVWVLTAGHVIESLKQTRRIVDDEGNTHIEVAFPDVQIRQFLKEGGRKVGEMTFDAEVVRYSNPDNGEDLALLRIRSKQFKAPASIKFYIDKGIPPQGTELYHCGSLLGEFGSNSLTTGIVSSVGRVFQSHVYDQTSCTAFPGSSGGPVVLKQDGRYVGMIVRGAGEGFNLIVPIRRIQEWADRVGVGFVIDDSKKVVSDEDLRKVSIEEKGQINVNGPTGGRALKDEEDDECFQTMPRMQSENGLNLIPSETSTSQKKKLLKHL